jgi:hypothetical protein
MRRVASSNEFFDILDKIGNGKFVTIGYVTGANLDVPKVSRKNPLTNRMKQYPDYTVFGNEQGEIGALVKITSYNMRYLNRTTVGQKYGEYKDSANVIRGNFGLDPIGSKQGYKQGTNWSPNGPEMYNGSNADLQGHSYNPQNIHGVKPKGVVYAVNKEGHIIKELTPEQVQPYLKAKREMDGVAALRKMGVEEERIQDYINQMNGLKFKYINFESNSILWIAATINGEKIVYINDNLSRAVDGININPQDFRAIARERYQIDLTNLQEMINRMNNKNKAIFRLTENELKSLIRESVQNVLEGWNSNLSPDALDDKAYMDDLYAQRDKMIDDAWEDKNRRIRQQYPGKSQEWYDAMLDVFENKKEQKAIKEGIDEARPFKNNQGYSHFAVSKKSGKIINGWDYKGYDPSELRQFKKDYFDVDLADYGFNPKDFRILTYKYLVRNGIDPNDNANWANNDEANAEFVG